MKAAKNELLQPMKGAMVKRKLKLQINTRETANIKRILLN